MQAGALNKAPATSAVIPDNKVWAYGFDVANTEFANEFIDPTLTGFTEKEKGDIVENIKIFSYNFMLLDIQNLLIKKVGKKKPKSIDDWVDALKVYDDKDHKRIRATEILYPNMSMEVDSTGIQIESIENAQQDFNIRMANLIGNSKNDLPVLTTDSPTTVVAKNDLDKYNLKKLKEDLLTDLDRIRNTLLVTEKLNLEEGFKKCRKSMIDSNNLACIQLGALCTNVTEFNKKLGIEYVNKTEEDYLTLVDTNKNIISKNKKSLDDIGLYIRSDTKVLFKDKNDESWKVPLIACTADLREAIENDEISYDFNYDLIKEPLGVIVNKIVSDSNLVDDVKIQKLKTQLDRDFQLVLQVNSNSLTTCYLRDKYFERVRNNILRLLDVDKLNYDNFVKLKVKTKNDLESVFGIKSESKNKLNN